MGTAGKRITLIDADPQGSSLDWSQQRSREACRGCSVSSGLPAIRCTGRPPSSRVTPITSSSMVRPRVAGLMRSALLAADLVLIPVQPSPFDGWASAEMLALIREARIYRPRCWSGSS